MPNPYVSLRHDQLIPVNKAVDQLIPVNKAVNEKEQLEQGLEAEEKNLKNLKKNKSLDRTWSSEEERIHGYSWWKNVVRM
jgi:hypothetical protein